MPNVVLVHGIPDTPLVSKVLGKKNAKVSLASLGIMSIGQQVLASLVHITKGTAEAAFDRTAKVVKMLTANRLRQV